LLAAAMLGELRAWQRGVLGLGQGQGRGQCQWCWLPGLRLLMLWPPRGAPHSEGAPRHSNRREFLDPPGGYTVLYDMHAGFLGRRRNQSTGHLLVLTKHRDYHSIMEHNLNKWLQIPAGPNL
jgi:hypothetical protein